MTLRKFFILLQGRTEKDRKMWLINIFKGMLIGGANIVPGVSGGTFALVLGIYERLIRAIGSIDREFFSEIIKGKLKEQLKRSEFIFLIQIVAGAGLSIAGFSWIIDITLRNYPGYTLSFFAGILLPSVMVPYKLIEEKNFNNAIFGLLGAAAVIGLYSIRTFGILDFSLPVIFLSGFFAISAMILPGISGSFILLVLGVYAPIIFEVKRFTSSFDPGAILNLSVFALGCIAGLVFFVRVLGYLFSRQKSKTLYFLVGLVIGSFFVLWPFKDYSLVDTVDAEFAIITAPNVLPSDAGPAAVILLFFLAGFAASIAFQNLSKKRKNT